MIEPQRSTDLDKLRPEFGRLLVQLLDDLARDGTPFKVIEAWRSDERQQWLYGQGRPWLAPYGRGGRTVTKMDGSMHRSRHQDGEAADLWPVGADGKVYCPPPDAAVWEALAQHAEALGLVSGRRFGATDTRPGWDSPHVERRRT